MRIHTGSCMDNLMLNLMPGRLGKYQYTRDLLKWTEDYLSELSNHQSTVDYPLIESVLLSSLERAAQDAQSVTLLRFVVNLRKQNERLHDVNQNPGNTENVLNTAAALQSAIPKLNAELKAKIKWRTVGSIVLFLLLSALVVFHACSG